MNYSKAQSSISQEREKVVLGLGSNCGESLRILQDAAERLGSILEASRFSSFYVSEPLYVLDQNRFINAAVTGLYAGSPESLLRDIQVIETLFGRDRSRERRRGERSLDIDILLFGSRVVDLGEYLRIPHPQLLERKFALLPLLELTPGAIDPRNGLPLYQSYAVLQEQGIYYAGTADYNRG